MVYHFWVKSTEYQPLRGDVSARIRERIVDGTYPAGSRLVERTIAAELGVSRVPVREALRPLLEASNDVDKLLDTMNRAEGYTRYRAVPFAELNRK